jgi:5-methylcytosine-specific restriction endonuclease McrA
MNNRRLLAGMKPPVTDAAVDEYVARILAGGPLGKLFPAKLSECDLSPSQREKIRKARAEKRTHQKNGGSTANSFQRQPNAKLPPAIEQKTSKALTKLRKMLYLQGGNCFFCGMPLTEEQASIEHLNPKSLGGTSTEGNEVVCHKTLNHTFGNMDLKRKFEFVLKTKGAFRCPGI